MSNMIDTVYSEMLAQDALKNRRITLNTDVNEVEIYKIMYYMDKIKKTDDNETNSLEIKDRKPIEIVINSYGGAVYECFALLSKMEQFQEMGYKINTTLTGKGMSCGQMIFMFGTKRRMYRYGTCLIHQISAGNYGNYEQLKVSHEHIVELQNMTEDMIVKKTKITKEMLKEKIAGKDWYLNAEQCLELGLATEIL